MSVYTDYNIGYTSTAGSFNLLSNLISYIMTYSIIMFAISIIILIAWYKIFEQNGEKGWKIFIPIYNLWLILKIVSLPPWLIFIPFINGFAFLLSYYKLAKQYGKSTVFAILTVLFSFICLPILAFTYKKSDSTENNSYNNIENQQEQINQQNINNNLMSNQNELPVENLQFNNNTQAFPISNCPNCGQQIQNNTGFCTNCGNKL